MRDQIEKYIAKMVADRSADPEHIAIAAQDDHLLCRGNDVLASLAMDILSRLNFLALVAARPSLPFADMLAARSVDDRIIPRDTETRTFLHDIPVLKRSAQGEDLVERIASLLATRKGVIVEGIGIFAVGALTVEQAYINYSSVFHSTFVKYLEDLLHTGYILPGEKDQVDRFRYQWLHPLTAEGLAFHEGSLERREDVLTEVAAVGRYTVERGLVDSFFGNISCRTTDALFISQTAASLDELSGCIDPIRFDNASTCGITASSELLAHRRIYEKTGCRFILHGHPKFSVIMSMQCEEQGCGITDCWKECRKVRFLGDTPVVAGEIGAGGLAKNVPPIIGEPRKAIVYGHGVFTIGWHGFHECFTTMINVENWCREEFFRRLDALFS